MKSTHPSQRFLAPNTILKGTPLKLLINDAHVRLIAEAIAPLHPHFDSEQFEKTAIARLNTFELKDRARHIADALNKQLPQTTSDACKILIESFGPELSVTENYGLAPFYYMPLSEWIGRYATSDPKAGLNACYQITKRYTAEFCIRPFLVEHTTYTLKQFESWVTDQNPHVRRLVSEGSRPKLPWAMGLPQFRKDPSLCQPLLEQLKDDPDLYVRRSVANHLGDVAKDHLELVFALCERWLQECQTINDPLQAKNRRWIIRHALRYPAKKGNVTAIQLRNAAK